MIKHIVMWKIKDSHEGREKQALMNELKQQLENLRAEIPEIGSLEVGLNVSERPSAFDVVLYSEFADQAALGTYRDHPKHIQVAEYAKTIVIDGAVVDYTV